MEREGAERRSTTVMLDLLDLILLRRKVPADDWTTRFRRIDGTPGARVIYFLPWNTPFVIARHAGLIPLEFLACYEMPPAIVSSNPVSSVEAMLAMVEDARELIIGCGRPASDLLIVGLSVGSYPATVLANLTGATLCSIASADRGDLMIWQSPAVLTVKQRAIQKGYRLIDFARAMRGYNPIDNMIGVRSGSVFVVGKKDLLVPLPRSVRLMDAGRSVARHARFVALDAGHIVTLFKSAQVQRAVFERIVAASTWFVIRQPRRSHASMRPRSPGG